MLKMKALKSEMAKAVLALGIAGATPVFAQEIDDTIVANPEPVPQTEVVSNYSRDWYNPEIPENVLYGLLLLAIAGSAYSLHRKTEGTAMRTVALAVGFAAVANPQNVLDEYRTLPTVIPVFVDTSMSVGDRAPTVEEAFTELETRLASLGPVTIRRIEFGHDEESRARPGTHLSGVLESTLDTIPRDQLGAVFVISDGVVSDQSHLLDIEGLQVPVHALIVGHDEEEDFFVKIEESPQIGIVGEEQEITFRIVDGRTPDGDTLRANVDVYYGGEFVRTMNVRVNEDQTLALSDLTSDGLRLGQNLIEFAIRGIQGPEVAAMDRDGDGAPDEVTLVNNRITTAIEGISSDIRVLLLTGEPHAGTRLWRTMLTNDSNVNLTHLGFLRPPSKEDATPLRDLATVAFPVGEILRDRIDEFDMVIIDNFSFNGVIPLEYFGDIREYVENGGGLLVVGAEDLAAPNSISNTMLGDILPIIPAGSTIDERFVPQISEDGYRHPIGRILSESGNGNQNWGPWYSLVSGVARDGATVLMTDGSANPLLALDRVGEGRVVVLGSDQNAIWASNHQGGGPAVSLYRSLSGWLTGVQRYEEENLTLRQEDGQIVIELQTMADAAEPIIITAPSGEEIEVLPEEQSLGLFVARIPADERGAYRARRTSDPTAQAYVGFGFADQNEIQNVISETEILRPLSDATEGITARISDVSGTFQMPTVLAANNAEAIDAAVDPMMVNMTTRQELIGTERKPMLPGWLYAMAFAGALLYSFKPKDKGLASWATSPFNRNKSASEPTPPSA
jgi:hypothetical protein